MAGWYWSSAWHMSNDYPFDRPVIILAAPRSGSTLLFETLSQSAELWTIGGESHYLIESIARFNPLAPYCDSNALYADDATPELVQEIRMRFFHKLRDARGRSVFAYKDPVNSPLRLLEKTPKNALRVSLLNRVFPDALFIYLYRNPRENISSMMDAWRSGRFITYPSLPGRNSPWSLLLPPGWQSYHEAPLEDIVAFQWRAANMSILQELGRLDPARWMAVSYGQQVGQPAETLQRICDFCQISAGGILNALSGGGSKLSRYTLSPPDKDKWRRNALSLEKILPGLRETMEYIKANTSGLPDDEFDLSLDPAPRDAGSPGAVQ